MANNLIKWWKTKFKNGYRQFSGSRKCQGQKMSDSEKLLENTDSDCNLRYDIGTNDYAFSNCMSSPTPTQCAELKFLPRRDKQHFNLNSLENFSYVSMDGGIDQSDEEQQEFLFTLYDFDGHGKISKNDIAGLVTTIYETLQSYVQIPYYGSKTIKVKLIISPNQDKNITNTIIDKKVQTKQCSEELKSDLIHINPETCPDQDFVKSQDYCKKEKKSKTDHFCCRLICEEKNSAYEVIQDSINYPEYCNQVPYNDNEEFQNNLLEKQNERIADPHYPKYIMPKYNFQNSQNMCISICPMFYPKNRKDKNRSSSLQRQELLKIIQANMNKNNLCFQTNRKHCPSRISNYLQNMAISDCEQENTQQIIRPKSSHILRDIANIMTSKNYFVNLSSLQPRNLYKANGNKLSLSYYQYDKLLNAVVSMSNRHLNTDMFHRSSLSYANCKCRKHHRLKNNDLMQVHSHRRLLKVKRNNSCKRNPLFMSELLKKPKSIEKFHTKTKYETKHGQLPTLKKHSRKFSRVILGHSPSPHHLKHRNRKEDQARAMAQVVSWLEKEVSTTANIRSKLEKKASKAKPSPVNNKSNIKYVHRHEHHHVHKHIHHHYHHFQKNN